MRRIRHLTTDFQRLSLYAYHSERLFERLRLTAGLAYDRVTFPENFRAAPISDGEKTVDQLGPKFGAIWTPTASTTVRASFTRSLGGASFDQSLRLEPSTVAGFLQSFRSVIPESIGGAEAGAEFQTFGLSLEQRFPTGTYLALTGQILGSTVDRTVGVFLAHAVNNLAGPSSFGEHLDYTEATLGLSADQLLGERFSVGARYRLTDAGLTDDFPGVSRDLQPSGIGPPFRPAQHVGATLQQLSIHAVFNDGSGAFAQVEGLWTSQSNRGYSPGLPDSDFWQFNVFAGYRFLRRRAELTLGLLNLADRDYHLNPLTLYNDLPRGRTIILRLLLSF